MFDVTCLGVIVADNIAKTVECLPEKGKLLLIDKICLQTGGCAANAAIDLSRIGVNTAIIGKVGKDGLGEFMSNSLIKEGVNIQGLIECEGTDTSTSLVLISENGERSFLHCIGSNGQFTFDDVNFDIICESKVLFIAGTNLMPAFDGKPCSEVLKKAQELGVYTVLDTAWDTSGRWMKIVEPCLPYINLFIPSLEEAQMIADKEEPDDIANVLLSKGVELAVIKLGKEGCYIKHRNGEHHSIPTYKKVKVIDTTGAGDSFSAGFIAAILEGWDLYQCGKFANAVGSNCVMQIGASTGIKSKDEILRFIMEYERGNIT